MFFKKKKIKIDPKIRFQNRQFNQKLHQARTFKRTAKPIPDSSVERFLRRIGLGSRWMQILVALIALGVIYIIYAPNFLSVQTIRVEGLSEEDRISAEKVIQDSLNSSAFYNPQRNLLFLSKARVRQVVSSIHGVDTIEVIDKDFGQKILSVKVKPKRETFLVRSNDLVFDIFNDGVLKGPAGVNRDAWLTVQNPGMAKVDVNAKILSDQSNQEAIQFFSKNTVEYITKTQEALKGIVGSPIAYFSIRIPELREQQELLEQAPQTESTLEEPNNDEEPSPEENLEDPPQPLEEQPVEPPVLPVVDVNLPINADELDIFLYKGTNLQRTFKVIVDTKENPEQLVQRLNLLLSQTAPDRYNNLSYIDLRIQSRAYVCLVNTVCNR